MGCIPLTNNSKFLIHCPLNHQLRLVRNKSPNRKNLCQICKDHYRQNINDIYYFHCNKCNYKVCSYHYKHQQFCTKITYKCTVVENNNNQICFKCKCPIKYNKFSITKCTNCQLIFCTACQPCKHYEIQNVVNFRYQDNKNKSHKCFDCYKQIKGGLYCSVCQNYFCSRCEVKELQHYKNNKNKKIKTIQDSKINADIDMCSICFQKLASQKIKLACGHEYHGKCLAAWKERTCPYCRQEF